MSEERAEGPTQPDVMSVPVDSARTVVINLPRTRLWPWALLALLCLGGLVLTAFLIAGGLVAAAQELDGALASTDDDVQEVHVEGPTTGSAVAIISLVGTISPPYTDDWLKQIERAREDDEVRAILLHIDSPGGLVADSHQIFHRLRELSAEKPMAVQFGRLAASGGYYVAMGAGPEAEIVAEPTTWTGSIGVIVPYYNATELAETVGIRSQPLKTGRYKDTLNPFREPTADELALWEVILDDAFDRFKDVVEVGRPRLERAEIDDAATGQIFTANQALERGLVDRIGYRDETIAALAKRAKLDDPRVIEYVSPVDPLSFLLGQSSAAANRGTATERAVERLVQSARPEAYYLYGWPTTLLPR